MIIWPNTPFTQGVFCFCAIIEAMENKHFQKTILLIEDEKPIARVLSSKLESEGFLVLIAQDGEKALSILREGHVDFVVLDLVLPHMDGFEVLRGMRIEGIQAPVVVVTNLSQEEDKDRVAEFGVLEYFVKPNVTIEDVVGYIKAFFIHHEY